MTANQHAREINVELKRLTVSALAAVLAVSGIGSIVFLQEQPGSAQAVELSGDDRQPAIRRDDSDGQALELVDDDDDDSLPDDLHTRDGDATGGNDGTSGGANTGDGDATGGNDGTSGGANTGDGDATGGNDGTSGGANTGDGDATGGNSNASGGDTDD
jgi:hypothetical protein